MIYHHRKNEQSTGEIQAQATYAMPWLLGLREQTVHGLSFLTHLFESLASL